MCIVYCITNLKNGKKYIGWTNKTLDERWTKHVQNALVRNRSFMLSQAIRKYGDGDDVWRREVLLADLDVPSAKLHEIRLIAEHSTNGTQGGHGYNMTDGGDGGTASGEHNPFFGRQHTEESKQKMRETLGDKLSGHNNPQHGLTGELSPNWGRKHSEESKRKRSEKLKGRIVTKETREKLRQRFQDPEVKARRSQAQKARRERERKLREDLHQSSAD